MIKIHTPCLEELTEKSYVGTQKHFLNNKPAFKLYNCPSCESTVSGTEIYNTVDLYIAVSKYYSDRKEDIISACGEIDVIQSRIDINRDKLLRQQLSIYKSHLLEDKNE